MQRGLPRPDALTALQEAPSLSTLQDRPLEMAEALLQNELFSLLQYEATKYPIKKKGKRKRGESDDSVPLGPLGPWEDFPVSFLNCDKLQAIRLGDCYSASKDSHLCQN